MLCVYVLLAWKMYQSNIVDQKPVDMLLVSVPYSEMSYPPCGPAVLKGIAHSHGYSIITRDLAVDFEQFMAQYPDVDRVEVMSTWVTAFDK
jgi:hypothetical protein